MIDTPLTNVLVSVPQRQGQPALNKAMIGGLKDPLSVLVVMSQTKAPRRGPKVIKDDLMAMFTISLSAY
jgi:hypothetical protein